MYVCILLKKGWSWASVGRAPLGMCRAWSSTLCMGQGGTRLSSKYISLVGHLRLRDVKKFIKATQLGTGIEKRKLVVKRQRPSGCRFFPA